MFAETNEAPLTPEQADLDAEELRVVLRQRDQLSLRAAQIAARLASVGYGESLGSISTPDWIRHECKLGFQAAADLVCVGQGMAALGASVAAVEEAEIGFQHLVYMARTKHAVGERPINQEHLLAEAKEVSVGRFWHLCQQARHAADAEGMAREQAEAVEQRVLRLSQQQDGTVTLNGVLEPGREKRVISPQLRKPLEVRDKHCRFPGCSRRASWCEAHHVVSWVRGGATNLDNLVLLCNRHHMQVHEGRWQLFRYPDGHVEVLKPPLDFAAPPRGPAIETAA